MAKQFQILAASESLFRKIKYNYYFKRQNIMTINDTTEEYTAFSPEISGMNIFFLFI